MSAGVADVSALTECSHCGLPVPTGFIDESSSEQFCCRACHVAWDIIHDNGLDRYYEIRRRTVERPERAAGGGDSFLRFDDPAFVNLYVNDAGDDLRSVDLLLDGVHCAACVWLVEALPRVAPGVRESRLDFGKSTARIVWAPGETTLSRVASTLDSLGYRPSAARGASVIEHRRREDRRFLTLIAVAGACAGNVMLISGSLYAGAFTGMSPTVQTFFRLLAAALGVVALLWPGAVFFRGAIAALRVRRLHLDLPISIGLAAGGVWGVANAIRGTGEIYFDSVTGVIFLLLIGRWLQRRHQRSATDAVELLYTFTPTSATILDGDERRTASIEEIQPGDVVEVDAGDSIPVDGVVVDGATSVEESMLTGEPAPRPVEAGDKVNAGAVNLDARVSVRVESSGEATRVAGLMRLVESAAERKAPIELAADRLAGAFVAVALTLGLGTLVVWSLIDPTRAVDNAIALLIVTCPCALGLATPLAVSAAIGRAGRCGILIKGGDVIERLARPGTILLDKTGTLTEGRCRVERVLGDTSVLPSVGAIESHSAHPLARAMREAFGEDSQRAATNVTQVLGKGIRGEFAGRRLVIGQRSFVEEEVGLFPNDLASEALATAAEGLTPVFVGADGAPVAVIGVGDRIRDDAADSVAHLRRHGWRIAMLSGDDPDVVRGVGALVGIDEGDCHGGVKPESKMHVVQQMQDSGPVVMVGDGVNDAAALSAADVGIAMHGGAEASATVADVALTREGVAPVADTIDGAARAMHVIRRNLRVSLFYNGVCATSAMLGFIHPLLAAVLMPLSSITVITLSYRSRTFGSD